MPVMRLVAIDTVIVRLNVTDRDVVLQKGMEAKVHPQAVATPLRGPSPTSPLWRTRIRGPSKWRLL